AGVTTRALVSGAPLLADGLAGLDCRVVHTHPAGANTLFIAEVLATRVDSVESPLAYHNREYRLLKE
ncbi:MAG: flavin reductase family protein, partial [Chloroflexota bacterium]